jgi:hypothetical protein
MLTLVSQTRKAMQSELYYVALMSALSIPDIAGALGADDGKSNRERYIKWYEKWVRPRLKENRDRDNPFSGADCYFFRCSIVHQGSSQHEKSTYKRIIFVEPGHPNYNIHYCVIGGEALLIQIDQFVEEALQGCELWLKDVQDTEPFRGNYARFARRHPQGIDPYVLGVPVVG